MKKKSTKRKMSRNQMRTVSGGLYQTIENTFSECGNTNRCSSGCYSLAPGGGYQCSTCCIA